jgi:hypothetical protein
MALAPPSLRKSRHGRAQHVHVRRRAASASASGIGGDEQRFRRKTASLFDARPQQAAARGILPSSGIDRHRREPRIDHALRVFERDAGLSIARR